ncbi:MAG: hypothetical protein ACR2ID_04375 [Chthoniobacterales bacterium]
MPDTAESETSLIEAIRALPEESQRSVLSYALFLRQQDEERRLLAEDALWDESLSDPVKTANFHAFAERSHAGGSEPLDPARL